MYWNLYIINVSIPISTGSAIIMYDCRSCDPVWLLLPIGMYNKKLIFEYLLRYTYVGAVHSTNWSLFDLTTVYNF